VAAEKRSLVFASECDLPIKRPSLFLDGLLALCNMLPRGRGAVARAIGRLALSDRLYEAALPNGSRLLWTSWVFDMLAHMRGPNGWDRHVLDALRRHAQPQMCFWDVGANIGYMAASLAHEFPRMEVVAFEPIPSLAGALARTASHSGYGNLKVIGAALSARDAPIELFLGSHSVHSSMRARGDCTRIEVPGYAADTLVEQFGLRPPDLIKVDVEGAEMLFLDGARTCLAAHHPTIVYECDENALRFGHSPGSFIVELQSLGYDQFFLLDAAGKEIELRGDALIAPEFGNFLARRQN